MSTATTEAPPVTADTPKTELIQPKPPVREIRVSNDDSQLDFMLDTAKFEHIQRYASLMAKGTLTPKHLKGDSPEATMSNCFRVINQALRWGVDPFALADESYVVGGKLGYQGKLVAAIVLKHSKLQGRLTQSYVGKGMDRTVTITGRFIGEDSDRTIELSVAQAKTDNGMWIKDPDQKLWYTGVTKWARRHCPEVLLGVLTDDDLEQITASEPKATPLTLAAVTAPRVEHSFIRDDMPDRRQMAPVAAKPVETPKQQERRPPNDAAAAFVTRINSAATTDDLDAIGMELQMSLGDGSVTKAEFAVLSDMLETQRNEWAKT